MVSMRRHEILAASILLLAPSVSTAADLARFPLVRDGRAACELIVARPGPLLAPALDDLVRCVRSVSGAELPLVVSTRDRPGPSLHIGRTELAARVEEPLSRVRQDGYCLVLRGEDAVLVGRDDAGTANGVWSLLEDDVGVRWYGPGELWEVLPSRRGLEIRLPRRDGEAARVVRPSFAGRHYWGRPPGELWARRMRLSAPGYPMPYVGTSHTLGRVVPLSRFASSHPDYFALVGGRRVTDRESQPCFSHPDMVEVFLEHFRGGGSGFGVNDNRDVCGCARCRELDGESPPYFGIPSASESYFALIERVARRAREEAPERRLGVFAYQTTNSPPRSVEHIGSNVDVVLCQDTSQHFDAEVRATDLRMTEEWVRKAGGVSLYDYLGISYWTPRYFPSLVAQRISHAARSGVIGYRTHASSMPDTSMPMFYLYARMLWNHEVDAPALIDEMLADLYGEDEAAAPIRAFYDGWERGWLGQREARWLRGMDDFRAEMSIWSPSDFARGRGLLEEAAARARRDVVRRRVAALLGTWEFTEAAAAAHFASATAVTGPPPSSAAAARERVDEVVRAWRAFAAALERIEKVPYTPASHWHPKTFRVRAWALKQQVRDACVAPLVRWVLSAEGRTPPGRLRSEERDLARVALRSREEVEALVTETVGAARRPPRVPPLRTADIPRWTSAADLPAGRAAWRGVPPVRDVPWVYRARDRAARVGKYEEPMLQHLAPDPAPEDLAVEWRAAWTDEELRLRVEVRDDVAVDAAESPTLERGDALRLAFLAPRDRFPYDQHSWYFLMGDWRRETPAVVVALGGGRTRIRIEGASPAPASGARALRGQGAGVRALATRRGSRTVYEVAIGWAWLAGFEPRAERSLGISVVVADDDGDGSAVLTAEYGDGVFPRRRPTEFAAIRLIER